MIVPIRGDLDQAWKCFLSLAQTAEAPSHEIVVVDDGAVDLGTLLERLGGSVQVVETGGGVGIRCVRELWRWRPRPETSW